jgi:F0F1-type ATP synthase epsilon subunit
MPKDYLKVKIFWMPLTKEVFYQGEALSVSSQNQLGKFDILPKHTNFITLIFDELSIMTSKGEKITYHFKRGVLEVTKNRVNIYLGL